MLFTVYEASVWGGFDVFSHRDLAQASFNGHPTQPGLPSLRALYISLIRCTT